MIVLFKIFRTKFIIHYSELLGIDLKINCDFKDMIKKNNKILY